MIYIQIQNDKFINYYLTRNYKVIDGVEYSNYIPNYVYENIQHFGYIICGKDIGILNSTKNKMQVMQIV